MDNCKVQIVFFRVVFFSASEKHLAERAFIPDWSGNSFIIVVNEHFSKVQSELSVQAGLK